MEPQVDPEVTLALETAEFPTVPHNRSPKPRTRLCPNRDNERGETRSCVGRLDLCCRAFGLLQDWAAAHPDRWAGSGGLA